MGTKHTKGEWSLSTNCRFIKCNGGIIASISMYEHEWLLNAKLIAAAPDMLESLKMIWNTSHDSGRDGCTYGDTDYDSQSVVYGYNMCLDYLREIAEVAIKKATE